MALISLSEYARRHGRAPKSVRDMAERAVFKTAQKIGRNWVISENEAYPDSRVKSGKYVGKGELKTMKIYLDFADGKKEFDLLDPSVLAKLPVPELWKYFQSKYSEINNGPMVSSEEIIDKYKGRNVYSQITRCQLRGYTIPDYSFTDLEHYVTQELFVKRIYSSHCSPRHPLEDTEVTIVHVSQYNDSERPDYITIRDEEISGYII